MSFAAWSLSSFSSSAWIRSEIFFLSLKSLVSTTDTHDLEKLVDFFFLYFF